MKKMKGLVLALGLSLLLIPSGVKADKLTDPYIPKIESGEILPPQYIGTDNKPIKDKIPSPEEWKKSVKAQGRGAADGLIKIDPKKKKFRIKKVDQKGEPIKGAVFNFYNSKIDAEKEKNVVKTVTSDEKGIVEADSGLYYDFYVREKSVPSPYVVKDDVVGFYRDNGVRFLGELEPKNMKVTSINQDGKEKSLDSNKSVNQELQSLVNGGNSFNQNTNWLVYNDNGTEKLVTKKPLKRSISWNSLYKSGLVFGEDGIKDLINADFSNTNYYNSDMGKDSGKGKDTPKTYKPTYVTINNKRYILRLMRAYNESVGINESHNWGQLSSPHYNATKDSEWNRLILPLIDPTGDDNDTGYDNGTNGRYGSDTKKFVESNMPILANYSWWTDFGSNSNSSGSYSKGDYYGVWRWTQETAYDGNQYRAGRGGFSSFNGAVNPGGDYPNHGNYYGGWLPVLELVD